MYNAESIFQNIFLSSPYFYDQLEGGKSSSSKQSAADRQQQGIRVAAVLILLSKNDAANGKQIRKRVPIKLKVFLSTTEGI